MPLSGVILAAGAGTRLGELGRRYSKPMVPIGERPLIHWCATRLRAAGIERLVVVSYAGDTHLREFLRVTLPEVTVVVQKERLGTADALRCALPELTAEPAFVACACDSLFLVPDLERLIDRGRAQRGDAVVGVLQMGSAAVPTRSGLRVQHDRVVEIMEKPPTDQFQSGLVAAPLYWVPQSLAPYIEHVRPLGRERYVTSALGDYITAGGTVWAVPLRERVEITTAEDVRRAEVALAGGSYE